MSQRFFFASVVLTAALAAILQAALRDSDFLPGDCFYYALTVESLLNDGDLDLTNQLLGDEPLEAGRDNLRPHEGFFAVSPAGRVVPKHSILLPLVSLPLAGLFGAPGLLLTNILIAVALVLGVSTCGGDCQASRLAALVVVVSSSWLAYCFNYSPDLLVSALVVWSYAQARRQRWWLTGLLAGLAVWAKIYAAVLVLPLAIVIWPAGRRATLDALLGVLIGVAPMLILNTHLYGGPLVTGYDRDGRVEAEGFSVREHYSLFNQPVIPGLGRVLFDGDCGMIRTAPIWFLWPLGLALGWRDQPASRRFMVALALGAVANVLLFALYEAWNQSIQGNRFLFPSVALGGALLTPIALRCASRLGGQR